MNRGFGIFLAVPVFLIAIFTVMQIRYVAQEEELWEEYVINFAIDYATDAAAEELLEQADVSGDYYNMEQITVDPWVALSTFKSVMLITYNFPFTQAAQEALDAGYMPIFCVAAYDGYYVYDQYDNPKFHTTGLQSTPKLPYTYEESGVYYSLNLGLKKCYRLEGGDLRLVTTDEVGLTEREQLYQINGQVSDDLLFRFQRYQMESGRGSTGTAGIYIPQGLTSMTSVNAIEGPTVMAFIDKWDLNTTHPVSAFSIGGAKLEPARMVVGYKYAGDDTPYYAYADLIPDLDLENPWGIDIAGMFTSPDEAARAGYFYDERWMDR